MLRWARAWRLPFGRPGPSCPSFPGVSVAPSGSGNGGGAEPRPLRLSYTLLDGEPARPALVFLHGLFGCKTNFNSIAKALAQQTGRRVLTVDARNHGDSPHSPDMSYEAMSQDLQDLLLQLGLAPCVLVGHSMGGKTAMLLALQRPELVERLIAVDISPMVTTSVSDFPTYMAAMRAVAIPAEVPRSRARKLADEQLSSVIKVMQSSPPVVAGWDPSREEWETRPPTAGPPTGRGRAAVPAHQPGGGGRALCVEGELGCLGPARGHHHGLPTSTGLLPRANSLPPWCQLQIRAVSQAGWQEEHAVVTQSPVLASLLG
nr:protein ABHD11 isoform X1 [Dasypus novemcinctus]